MQYRLRTLLIFLAVGPPVVAWGSGRSIVSVDTCCNVFLALGWLLVVFGLWCLWPASFTGFGPCERD
jgi:hypothetical protein